MSTENKKKHGKIGNGAKDQSSQPVPKPEPKLEPQPVLEPEPAENSAINLIMGEALQVQQPTLLNLDFGKMVSINRFFETHQNKRYLLVRQFQTFELDVQQQVIDKIGAILGILDRNALTIQQTQEQQKLGGWFVALDRELQKKMQEGKKKGHTILFIFKIAHFIIGFIPIIDIIVEEFQKISQSLYTKELVETLNGQNSTQLSNSTSLFRNTKSGELNEIKEFHVESGMRFWQIAYLVIVVIYGILRLIWWWHKKHSKSTQLKDNSGRRENAAV